MNFIFQAKERISFKARLLNSLKTNGWVAIAIFTGILLMSGWPYALLIAVFFFIIQIAKAIRWEKYYIRCFELKDNIINIEYTIYDQENKLQIDKQQIKIKKKIAFNRTKTVYLAIYVDNTLEIKQFECKDWNETVFDQIIDGI